MFRNNKYQKSKSMLFDDENIKEEDFIDVFLEERTQKNILDLRDEVKRFKDNVKEIGTQIELSVFTLNNVNALMDDAAQGLNLNLDKLKLTIKEATSKYLYHMILFCFVIFFMLLFGAWKSRESLFITQKYLLKDFWEV